MDEPSLEREMTVHAAEHEIFLSFHNDEDAELFQEWWNSNGWPAFRDWAGKELHKRQKEYDE